MSLLAMTRAAVETAFGAAGDLVVSDTWRRAATASYSTEDGTPTATFDDRIVRAVEDKVSVSTANRLQLSASAVRLWIPAVDFEGTTEIFPTLSDKVIHRGKTYRVRECAFAGTKALWEIHADA
jgi:hypothetical protein